MLSLCLFLGACGGGTSSSPSNNNSDSAEETPSPEEEEKTAPQDPKECGVENGKGQKNWNAELGDWNDECELIACNAGHDNQNNQNICAETPAGHYSPVDSKKRTACEGKPDDGDASWTEAKGLAGPDECEWTCDGAGYDNQENNAQCEATIARHYSPAGSNGRIACPDKPDDSSWTAITGLTAEADCDTQAWTCNGGFDNQANSDRCEASIAQHYSPAGSNARIACTKPDDSSWTTTTGLTSEADCDTQAWTCDVGHDNSQNDNVCAETAVGYYSPANTNGRTECTKPA